MPVFATTPRLSVEDFLSGEERAEVRHEYVAGDVYAMGGASTRHNGLALNLSAALLAHVRGGPCKLYMSDVKVRIQVKGEDYFYYPDVMVTCRPDDAATHYRVHPKVLVEVLSPSTERTDRREKRFLYQCIPALEEYVLVSQESRQVTVYRRATDWNAVLPVVTGSFEVPSLGFTMALDALYEGTGL